MSYAMLQKCPICCENSQDVAKMPYCCKNALNMLQKYPNFTMHILIIVIAVIVIIVIIIISSFTVDIS